MLLELPAHERDAAYAYLSVTSGLELLTNSAARRRFERPACISVLDYTTGIGADHATYSASVSVPGENQSRVLAVGNLAETCFAFEIHQAFLSLANERATRIPESRVRTLGFRMGEGKKSFRIGPVRGIDSTSPGGVVGAEARAVAQSHAASKLVWRHFSDMNEAITRQLEGVPLKKAEVSSAVRALYISRGDESAAAYHKFRSAVVDFLRARHLIQRRILGRRIFEEFTLRGGGAEHRAATAGPVPAAVAAASPLRPAALQLGQLPSPPSPLTGDLARRMRLRLQGLETAQRSPTAASPLASSVPRSPVLSPLMGDLAERLRSQAQLQRRSPPQIPPRALAMLLQPGQGAGEISDEGSFHDSRSTSTSSRASSLDRSWLSETDEPRYASV